MKRDQIDLDGSSVVVERAIPPPNDLAIAERNGWGHPDTLADHLAERLSRAYSRYTHDEFGVVLHHNFDKLALLADPPRSATGSAGWPIRCGSSSTAAQHLPLEASQSH